jgi:hypothetical protein
MATATATEVLTKAVVVLATEITQSGILHRDSRLLEIQRRSALAELAGYVKELICEVRGA